MIRNAIAATALLTLSACSGSSSGPAATEAAPKDTTAAEAQTWPAKWCKVQVGMSRDQVTAIMGQPTELFTGSMKWRAFEYRYSAFFSAAGAVRQLDMDSSLALTAGCAGTRRAAGS